MTKNKLIITLSIVLLISTLFISIGYSAFEKTFKINESLAHVRITKDVRITDFKVDSAYNDALAEGEDFDYNMANVDLLLPKTGSYVSYSVTMTNLGNSEAILSSVKIIGENAAWLDVEVVDYELGTVIEDNAGTCVTSETGCMLGVSRTFNIRVKNKPGVLYSYYHYRNVYIEFQFSNKESIQIGDNVLTNEMIINNSYIETNGAETPYAGWASSNFIDVSNYRELLFVGNGSMLRNWNACYDENKNFLSMFQPQSGYFYNEKLGKIDASISFYKVSTNCKYIRVSDSASVVTGLRIYPLLTESYDHHFKFLYNPVSYDELIFGDNHLNYDEIVPNTYISNVNGTVIPYGGWYSTGFIDIHDLTDYVVSSPISFSVNAYSAYYDENYNYVSPASLSAIKQDVDKNYYATGTRPANAYYVRFSDSSASKSYYSMNVSSYSYKTFNVDPSLNENIVIGENIFDPNNIVENQYIESNGVIVNYSGWAYSDYYPIGKGLIIANSIGAYNSTYKADYSYSSSVSCSVMTMKNELLGNVSFNMCYIKPTTNNQYVRFSNSTASLRNYKVYPVLNDDFNYFFEFELR